jgi:hypothetical protein
LDRLQGVQLLVALASSAKSIIMIAFFFTMPMRRTIPMSATMSNSIPQTHQREQRAHAGRGQRREDGDGVDVALVEDAEHDVDGDQRGEHEDRLVASAVAELLRRALEAGVQAPGQPIVGSPADGRRPRAERVARRHVEESVTEGNWPWWFTVSGAVGSTRCTTPRAGTRRPALAHVDAVERVGPLASSGSPRGCTGRGSAG